MTAGSLEDHDAVMQDLYDLTVSKLPESAKATLARASDLPLRERLAVASGLAATHGSEMRGKMTQEEFNGLSIDETVAAQKRIKDGELEIVEAGE